MKNLRIQNGFAAIAAIFLVVVLAALGAFMLTFSNTSQMTSAQDIQGTRAYWAARAGLEWAIAKNTFNCTNASPTIDGFTVSITCVATPHSDDVPINVFSLQAEAKTGGAVGTMGYIERSVSVSVCRTQAAPYAFC